MDVDGVQVALGESALVAFLLALARTGAFVLITPPFSARNIPAQARVGLAVALALPLSALGQARAPQLGSASMLLQALNEALIGVVLGYFVLLAVATIQTVGELLDIVGGFTLTASLDPMLLAQTSVMGKLHQLTAAAVLFATGGHLMVLHGLARTFQMNGTSTAAPTLDFEDVARAVTGDVATLFVAAIQICAPVIAAMLVADVALGLLTRAAPALNPFALGFPLKILFTLLLAGLVLTRLPQALARSVEHGVVTVLDLVRAAGGG
jgi:flagellar biosynthetic protein FliR